MKLKLKSTAAALALAASVGGAYAAPQTVGGVTWDPESALDFSSFSVAIRQFVNQETGELSGYGFISTMNGTGQNQFCVGCELTFTYSGFTPIPGGQVLPQVGQTVNYTSGTVNVYVDNTPEITNPSDPTSLTLANTSDGDLWLSLVGNTVGGAPSLTGTATEGALPNMVEALSGLGLLDVVGGLAAANFDTNTRARGADFSFSNSFTLFFPQGNFADAGGTGNFFGDSIANEVPEPSALALVGLGLLAAGATRRSKKA